MSIIANMNQVQLCNQAAQSSQTGSSNQTSNATDTISAANGRYSVFTNNANNNATNYFSFENLGANLAANIQSYIGEHENLDNVQKFELAPAITNNQTGNGFAGLNGDDNTINALTRYLTRDENKEALTQMCKLFGIEGTDYRKLQDAMISANKDNNLEITREEIENYKKIQEELNSTQNHDNNCNHTTNNHNSCPSNDFQGLIDAFSKLLGGNPQFSNQGNQSELYGIIPIPTQTPAGSGIFNMPLTPQNSQYYSEIPLVNQSTPFANSNNYGNINNGLINNGLINNGTIIGGNNGYPQNINVTHYPGIPGLFMPPDQMTTEQKVINGLYNLVDLIEEF